MKKQCKDYLLTVTMNRKLLSMETGVEIEDVMVVVIVNLILVLLEQYFSFIIHLMVN